MRIQQWFYTIPLRLRSVFRRDQVENELDEEIRYHVEKQTEEYAAQGLPPTEARAAALRAIGGLEQRKEECRDHRGVSVLENVLRDTKYAFRTLRRDSGFTIGVLLLLVVGIGANVAVFSIVNGILLRPLPYRDPDRLFAIQEIRSGSETGRSVNALHFLEWQRECDCFADVALSEYVQEVNLAGDDEPERVPSIRVTPNAFSLLGISAQIGRTFVPEDGRPGQDTVVVISDSLWHRRFGADPDVIGRTVHLDGVPSLIVGVLPPGFRLQEVFTGAGARANRLIDVYRPWALVPLPWWGWTNNYSYTASARLRDGVSARAALEELNAIQAAIARERFEADYASVSLGAVLVPLHEWVTGESREGLFLLLAAVGTALLVACLNIANLMLVRATVRGREAGIRAALGASRMGIFRSVLIESAVLSLAGAAGGVGLAAGFLRFFASVAPPDLPRVDEVQMESTALLVALGFAVVATITFGLVPALRMTRVDPQEALHAKSRSFTESASRLRFRQVLVSLEVALSAMLLIVAGLLVTSFVRLDAVDRGFDPTNVLTAEVGLAAQRYPNDDAKLRFYESLLERLRSDPGVLTAGLTSSLPLRGSNWESRAVPAGQSPAVEDRPSVQYRFVSSGYFEAMGIPLLAGRSFVPDDYRGRVAVLSERAARLVWPPGGDAVGRYFWRTDPNETFEVIGLVPDVHSGDLAADPDPLVYAPLTAAGGMIFPVSSVAVRTRGDPSTVAGALRRAVASLDPGLAVSRVQTMRQIDSAALGERRFRMVLVVAFGAASLLIAVLGTYSVLAYSVTNRTQEIAIRLTLGARPSSVRAMVLRQGLRPVVLGLVVGVAGALGLGRLLSSLLFSVTPTDIRTFVIVGAVTLAAAVLALWIPARRAARTPLLDALRYE